MKKQAPTKSILGESLPTKQPKQEKHTEHSLWTKPCIHGWDISVLIAAFLGLLFYVSLHPSFAHMNPLSFVKSHALAIETEQSLLQRIPKARESLRNTWSKGSALLSEVNSSTYSDMQAVEPAFEAKNDLSTVLPELIAFFENQSFALRHVERIELGTWALDATDLTVVITDAQITSTITSDEEQLVSSATTFLEELEDLAFVKQVTTEQVKTFTRTVDNISEYYVPLTLTVTLDADAIYNTTYSPAEIKDALNTERLP